MKPILFNTEMVKAILEGRKTTTRRVMKPQPPHDIGNVPYGVGDVLYVRETWNRGFFDSSDAEGDNFQWFEECHKTDGGYLDAISHYIYRADFTPEEEFEYGVEVKDGVYKMPWKPSLHMPKQAARIFLRVKSLRLQRLQDISADGIRREGLTSACVHAGDIEIARKEFALLWNSTIPKKNLEQYGWDANPWVYVIEFKRIEKPEARNDTR